MENLHLKSPDIKQPKTKKGMQQHFTYQTHKTSTTLLGKVHSKNEIMLTRKQLKEATWLFRQYGQAKPGWLRMRFIANQRRVKLLNDNLCEAQLDKAFCGKCSVSEDWSELLHSLWHCINKEPSCS